MTSSVPRNPSASRKIALYLQRGLTLLILFSLLPLASACDLALPTEISPTLQPTPATTPLPETMVTFRVQIPGPLAAGDKLMLDVLDEVTGLAFNVQEFALEAEDATHYYVILPFPVNSVLKYRYVRKGGAIAQEHFTDGRPVRYRMALIQGPLLIQDLISRWTDSSFTGSTGRLSGQVTDTITNQPVANLLINAGGVQTFSAADGTYLLEGLPPGTHNVVAYSLDGAYETYQQGAVIAESATTPAPLVLNPARRVKVVFTVTVPQGTLPGIPVRIAGNLYSLGNTYADLSGGISAVAGRMPTLAALPDGRYSITLDLPAGADLRYKYTLGDGVWNAEHKAGGGFRLRQLIVPDQTVLINDTVETWRSGQNAPITFDIRTPANTPPGDSVSIQFNPGYGWTEALPMWHVGDQRWIYMLFSPLDTLGAISYRYCRNEQCGAADDLSSQGPQARGLAVSTSLLPETIDDPVKEWAWLPAAPQAGIATSGTPRSRGSNFMAGVEFLPYYHPSMQPYLPKAVADVRSLSANWLFVTPTWTFTRQELPVLEVVPGRDPLWFDLNQTLGQAQAQALNVALFPNPTFPGDPNTWWASASRSFAWWNVWFERYETFLRHHATIAARQGLSALVIGGEWITPALPNGLLADGSLSNVPSDTDARWRGIISRLRQAYDGQLLWAMPASQAATNLPPFLDAVDQVYLLWSAPLAANGNDQPALAAEASRLLDEEILPLQQQIDKPILLGLFYPSAEGALAGCVPSGQGGCYSAEVLARPAPNLPGAILQLQTQALAYQAMFTAANDRDWIGGVVSRGYYPPAILLDKSASIHGKPAEAVLTYWFPKLIGP